VGNEPTHHTHNFIVRVQCLQASNLRTKYFHIIVKTEAYLQLHLVFVYSRTYTPRHKPAKVYTLHPQLVESVFSLRVYLFTWFISFVRGVM